MRALNFPAPRFPSAMLRLRTSISFGWDMGPVAMTAHQTLDRFANIAFVQTKMLRLTRQRFRSRQRNAVQGFLHQPLVVHVGPIHCRPQRNSATIDPFPGLSSPRPHPSATASSTWPAKGGKPTAKPRERWSTPALRRPASSSTNVAPRAIPGNRDKPLLFDVFFAGPKSVKGTAPARALAQLLGMFVWAARHRSNR